MALLAAVTAVALLALSCLAVGVKGFQSTPPFRLERQVFHTLHATPSIPQNTELDQEVRSMRIREIKQELAERHISTDDVFEKEELVQRLIEARSSSGKRKSTESRSSSNISNSNIITAPLLLTSLTERRVAAVNIDGGISIEPNQQSYPCIEIQVSSSDSGNVFPLTLLLDTACSGFVLRPEIVSKYDLPKLQTPVTMTGAGGTSAATGLTQLQLFSLDGSDAKFGPLPAAVQDIGALPSDLDGIIGLSFLSQFAAADLDFRQGTISLFRTAADVPKLAKHDLIAESDMRMIGSMGIFTVPVFFGGRGPVQMLVDTGAACTLLNWKGVGDLGLDRTSKQVQSIAAMGAMGSDNVAIQLTHRLNVSSQLTLGPRSTTKLAGVSLAGHNRLSVDIGEIPVIDSLLSQGVGGILGIDALMRCGVVRLECRSPRLAIKLYN